MDTVKCVLFCLNNKRVKTHKSSMWYYKALTNTKLNEVLFRYPWRNIMKKCINCGIEYNDETHFCTKCGEPLLAENACPKCGKSVSIEDTYCGNCGHKIEKEFKCEKCNASLGENAKFCPECGTKVEHPIVSIKQTSKTKSNKVSSNNLMNKIVFLAFSGTMILLFVLMLVGCFGDIFTVYETPKNAGITSLLGTNSKISIDYFFGKAAENIKTSTENMKYPEYKIFSIVMLVFEYICWIGAIAFAISGIVYASIKLYKGYQKNDYSLNNKFYVISALGGLPYLFIFAIQNSMSFHLVYSTSLASENNVYDVGLSFGWGTTMLLISIIVAVCLLALQRIMQAIAERNNIGRTSVASAVSIAFFVVLILSIGKVVGLDYSSTSTSLTGSLSVFSIFTTYLAQYSSDVIKEIPKEAYLCFVGSMIVLSSYLVGSLLIEYFLRKPENIIFSIVFGTLLIALTITGSVLTYQGAKESSLFSYLLGSSSEKQIFTYSAFGIVLPIVTALSVIGSVATQKIRSKA